MLIGENVEGTSRPLIMRAYEHEIPWELLQERLAELDFASQQFDYERVLTLLASLVRENAPVRHGSGELVWRVLAESRSDDAGKVVVVHRFLLRSADS